MIQKIGSIVTVLSVSASTVFFFLLWGAVAPEHLALVMQNSLDWTIKYFGWFYLLSMFGFLLFCGYLAFSRLGELRIGGEDAEPDFPRFSWFSMLFAAGMGVGLVFWGVAEPVSHMAKPPVGFTPETPEAARAALRFSFFHWGLQPWAAYCVTALALAYSHFNLNRPLLISSLFYSIFRLKPNSRIAGIFDVPGVIITAFGVATSLGFGAMQIGAGLNHIFGIPIGFTAQIIIIVIAAILYLTSALSGLNKGILWLSKLNVSVACILAVFLFITGPTAFILNAWTTTFGDYLNNLVSMSMKMTPFSRNEWVANWSLFYWAWWVAWTPFVGMFIARISRGRTVQEFVVGVLLVPTLASTIWFAIFGGGAMHLILFENAPLIQINNNDVSTTLFAFLEYFPLSRITPVVAVFLIVVFFITSADSATFVLGVLSRKGDANPEASVKIL